jgi:hypothetical protein
MLTSEEQRIAKSLYEEWFTANPGVKNPTDPNTQEKYDNMARMGWELFALMQAARKYNTEANEYPYPWTRWEYWEKQINTDQKELF